MDGQQGWPAWTWVSFGCCLVVFPLLAIWEWRSDQRGRDPLLKPGLLRQTSFSAGAIFAIAFFGGFSSVFFTLSILWQEGLGHSALITGLVIAPFSVGTLIAAANSDKLSARLGRLVLVLGCTMLLIGLGLTVLVLHLTAPATDGWDLAGPLLLAGLGTGMTIAPNQDFVLATVPRQEAGTASGILGTSQRLGTAIGIAVIGSVLFGTLRFVPGPAAVANAFSHSAQLALLANLGFVVLALVLVLALPRYHPGPPVAQAPRTIVACPVGLPLAAPATWSRPSAISAAASATSTSTSRRWPRCPTSTARPTSSGTTWSARSWRTRTCPGPRSRCCSCCGSGATSRPGTWPPRPASPREPSPAC